MMKNTTNYYTYLQSKNTVLKKRKLKWQCR